MSNIALGPLVDTVIFCSTQTSRSYANFKRWAGDAEVEREVHGKESLRTNAFIRSPAACRALVEALVKPLYNKSCLNEDGKEQLLRVIKKCDVQQETVIDALKVLLGLKMHAQDYLNRERGVKAMYQFSGISLDSTMPVFGHPCAPEGMLMTERGEIYIPSGSVTHGLE